MSGSAIVHSAYHHDGAVMARSTVPTIQMRLAVRETILRQTTCAISVASLCATIRVSAFIGRGSVTRILIAKMARMKQTVR